MGAVNYQIVENIYSFLTEQTGSVNGTWSGKLNAKDQRNLLGTYLGKGLIVINGMDQTVYHMVKVNFGNDTDWTKKMLIGGSEITCR